LDIPSFIPGIRQYFDHFTPTVRTLTLGSPKGSRREIIYFIGLFPHLEDLLLFNIKLDFRASEPMDDLSLVPIFVPPLRGRLVISSLKRVGFLRDMVHLFGGIRFCYISLFGVDETRFILNAGAGTLETVRLDPSDPGGEEPFPRSV
jgi:hypothetical protein